MKRDGSEMDAYFVLILYYARLSFLSLFLF